MSITASLGITLTSDERSADTNLAGSSSGQFPRSFLKAIEMAAGSGVGAIEKGARQVIALNNTNADKDLTAFADDASGANISFSKVKVFAVAMLSETSGDVMTVTPGASNGFAAMFADACVVAAGGILVFVDRDGATVDATHKVVNFALDHNSSLAVVVLGN